MKTFDRILIIKMSAIGDVVHALPFLEVLRNNHPRARIDWLVEEATVDLISGHPYIDTILVSRRNTWPRQLTRPATAATALKEIVKFIKQLRRTVYDLVIDLQGLLKSGLWLGATRATRKIGLSGAREGALFFTSEAPVPIDYDCHAIDRYLKVATHLGCRLTAWEGAIPVTPRNRTKVEHLLQKVDLRKGPVVAINPMARWESKLWMPERFAALADLLALDHGCTVVFTGSPSDRTTVEKIRRQMKTPALNLAGRTNLKELAVLLSRASVLICTDTGPMHIATAMKCPVVALFGPTAPWRTGPYGPGNRVIQAPTQCAPCFKKSCPDCRCMKDITLDSVAAAVRSIIQNG